MYRGPASWRGATGYGLPFPSYQLPTSGAPPPGPRTRLANRSRRPQPDRRRRRRRLVTRPGANSSYVGGFKKPRRVSKPSPYLTRGLTAKYDATWNASSDFSAWFGASTIQPSNMFNMAWSAFLRYYLSAMYKVEVRKDSDLPFTVGANGITYLFRIQGGGLQTTGKDVSGTLALPANPSFLSICNAVAGAWLYQLSLQSFPLSVQLKDFELKTASDVGDLTDMRCKMSVDNLYIKAFSTLTCIVQNVTTSDGGSLSTDIADTNPLRGSIYFMSTPYPILKQTELFDDTVRANWSNINRVNGTGGTLQRPDGVIWPYNGVGGASITNLTKAVEFQRPVNPAYFDTCTGVSNLELDPGKIKLIKRKFKFDGRFDRILTELYRVLLCEVSKDTIGTSIMFCLTKRLHTGLAPVAYNCETKWDYGAYVKFRKPKYLGSTAIN
nr:putative capsid protein [Cressdnaviricota sp.]